MHPVALPLVYLAALTVGTAGVSDAGSWKVSGPPAEMVRTLDNVTLDYRVIPDDYDSLKLSVEGCGEVPWYENDGLDPPADRAERMALLHRSVTEEFRNARLNCTLAEGIEDRIMTGFDDAYVQFEKLNH